MSDTELTPLRFSKLKLFAKSAAHFIDAPEEDTDSLRKGSALHSVLLGDRDGVHVYDGIRNKAHKAYQAFLADLPEDAKVMSPKEMVDVNGMRRSVEKHPRAMALLEGAREQTMYWDMSGRACRGTPDVVHLRGGAPHTLVELKSTQSSKPDLFKWQCRKLSYAAQCSWYRRGLSYSTMYRRCEPEETYIVAVESSRPYPVTVFRVTDKLLHQAEKQWRLWFEQLLVCERTGSFPGYAEGDVDLDAEDEETELEWDAT